MKTISSSKENPTFQAPKELTKLFPNSPLFKKLKPMKKTKTKLAQSSHLTSEIHHAIKLNNNTANFDTKLATNNIISLLKLWGTLK